MGDARFEAPLARVVKAKDRAAAIARLQDDEVLHALAAASRNGDAYLSNVLATEALNRHRRLVSLMWAASAGFLLALGVAAVLVVRALTSGSGVEPQEAWVLWAALAGPPLVAALVAFAWRRRALMRRARA